MNKEILCTGDSGTGMYCAECGKWRGSADVFIKIPEHPCFNCGATEIEVVSRFPIHFIQQTV